MTHVSFDERLSRIHTKHRRLSVGVTYKVGPDGLVIPVPRRRFAPRFPLRALLLLFVMGYAFKAILFVSLGEAAYGARLALLDDGSLVGQAAVWVMQPDPVVLTAAQMATHIEAAVMPLL